jgi:hypothetical protein
LGSALRSATLHVSPSRRKIMVTRSAIGLMVVLLIRSVPAGSAAAATLITPCPGVAPPCGPLTA